MCLDGRWITITVAHNPSHLSIYNRHAAKKITFSVGVSLKATGRMGSATAWVLRVAASGCTGASGPRASRGATVCASQPRPRPSTRAPGPTGCRTATAPRHTPMEVRYNEIQCLPGTSHLPQILFPELIELSHCSLIFCFV